MKSVVSACVGATLLALLCGCDRGSSPAADRAASSPANPAVAATAAASDSAPVAAISKPRTHDGSDHRKGTLHFSLTYLFSKAAGEKPDGKSLVVLIPAEGDVSPEHLGFLTFMDDERVARTLKDAGGYYLKVADNGTGTLTNITPGSYTLLLVSEHDWASETAQENSAKMLKPLFSDWGAISNKEVFTDTLVVTPGTTDEVSHVFGR